MRQYWLCAKPALGDLASDLVAWGRDPGIDGPGQVRDMPPDRVNGNGGLDQSDRLQLRAVTVFPILSWSSFGVGCFPSQRTRRRSSLSRAVVA